MSETGTDQASEDDLRGRIVAIFADSIGDVVDDTDDVIAIIRNEKLKLLDEVMHQSTVNLKSAKAVAGWAELRKEQLELQL